MRDVCLRLDGREAEALLSAVAWIRYHSNDIYPDVGSVDLFKAHLALENAMSPLPSAGEMRNELEE